MTVNHAVGLAAMKGGGLMATVLVLAGRGGGGGGDAMLRGSEDVMLGTGNKRAGADVESERSQVHVGFTSVASHVKKSEGYQKELYCGVRVSARGGETESNMAGDKGNKYARQADQAGEL